MGAPFTWIQKAEEKVTMETTIKEIAAVLRSTDKMADGFARRVQEKVGRPVPYTDILAVMREIPSSRLSMTTVVTKLKRELQ
jgi:hypothetical protein